jgi:nucleoside-diphosphate-sugar epimerase
MAKTILLTGATGFLGSHLLEALLNAGYAVSIFKRSTSDTWRIVHLLDRVKSYDVDKEPIAKAFEERRIDVVIHTACHYGRNGDPISEIVESNLMFGLRLLDMAKTHQVGTFLNADSLLPREKNAYALSKGQLAQWLKHYSKEMQVANLKIEHMYGPKDDTNKFVPWIIAQLQQNEPKIQLTPGGQKRDFIYIDDVVSAFMAVLNSARTLQPYAEFEVGTGQSIQLKEFLKMLQAAYHRRFGQTRTILDFGAIDYPKGEEMLIEADVLALEETGWRPTVSIEAGLEKVISVPNL